MGENNTPTAIKGCGVIKVEISTSSHPLLFRNVRAHNLEDVNELHVGERGEELVVSPLVTVQLLYGHFGRAVYVRHCRGNKVNLLISTVLTPRNWNLFKKKFKKKQI